MIERGVCLQILRQAVPLRMAGAPISVPIAAVAPSVPAPSDSSSRMTAKHARVSNLSHYSLVAFRAALTTHKLEWLINAHSGQNQPDNFEEIFKVLAQLATYLKEKC